MLPKFIITRDGVLRLGMVNQHKDLLEPEDDCIRWHLLDSLKVPEVYRGLRIIYRYDDDFHEDFLVSDVLKIEYY